MTRIGMLFFALLLFVYVTLAFSAAHYFENAELINRMGASLSAIGAIMIIFQVRREHLLELQNRQDLNTVRASQFSSADRERIESVRSQRELNRHHRRMRLVVCVAILVFVGEALHGWGDIVLRHIADFAGHSQA
jgi:hypothetical protein